MTGVSNLHPLLPFRLIIRTSTLPFPVVEHVAENVFAQKFYPEIFHCQFAVFFLVTSNDIFLFPGIGSILSRLSVRWGNIGHDGHIVHTS